MSRVRVIAAIVVSVLVVAAVTTYLVLRPDNAPAPATKKALAAVAVDVLDIEPSSYEPNPGYDVAVPLGVVVLWHPGGSDDAHRLGLDVRSDVTDPKETCAQATGCDTWPVDGGEIRLSWQDGHPEEDPGLLTVRYVTDGDEPEERAVTYSGTLVDGDPRDDELPVSVDELVGLVTDDRFASTTTQQMVDADLTKWSEEKARAAEAVPTTPQVVAQWLREIVGKPRSATPADTAAYGPDAVGTAFTFGDRTVSVVIVTADDAQPRCPAGWHCSKPRPYGFSTHQVVTGWKAGVVRVWVDLGDRTVLGAVRSPVLDRYPRPAWRFGRAGRAVESLVNSSYDWPLLTTREVRDAAEGLRWFSG